RIRIAADDDKDLSRGRQSSEQRPRYAQPAARTHPLSVNRPGEPDEKPVRRAAAAGRIARMRVLFSFVGGTGHAEPLLPFAAAVPAPGHEVAFTGTASVIARLRDRGFTGFARPPAPPRPPGPAISPLLAVDRAHERDVMRDAFADTGARDNLPILLAVAR